MKWVKNNIHKQPPEVFCKKKVFLKTWQISQGNTCAGGLKACNFIKMRL